jgi:hypothetical protein
MSIWEENSFVYSVRMTFGDTQSFYFIKQWPAKGLVRDLSPSRNTRRAFWVADRCCLYQDSRENETLTIPSLFLVSLREECSDFTQIAILAAGEQNSRR